MRKRNIAIIIWVVECIAGFIIGCLNPDLLGGDHFSLGVSYCVLQWIPAIVGGITFGR